MNVLLDRDNNYDPVIDPVIRVVPFQLVSDHFSLTRNSNKPPTN